MPSTKRTGDEAEGSARKKGPSAGRTGQACDRCKIRKIRCDARVGGCSPCIQNNTECKTTDRITGRANARGHAESLEHENISLKVYLEELQQQLRDNGMEPKAPPNVPHGYVPAQQSWSEDDQQQGSWGDLNGGSGLIPSTNRPDRQASQGSLLPDFRPGCIGDNYLGVSSGNNWLSSIEGTSLALFGMKLDLAELLPPESDPTAEPMSYRTFLLYSLGKMPTPPPPSLPSYDNCKQYAEWYFKSVQNFIPVLHRPDFMKLLANMFQGQYQPNAAETVMVHMVIMIMKFQYFCRNGVDQLRGESMAHYHYSLSFIPGLITGHTLQDIQALVMICSQLRNQPRPGAAWMFTNSVFGLAVEVGLHRSADNWQSSAAERDPHTIEMRKRIFWTILLLHVHLSGKLGRPMPIRLEDFDIEIPEAQADSLPEERHLTKWRKCSFRVAIQGFKLLRITMQVYSTLYTIRSNHEPHHMSVQNIEKQLDNFREQLPDEFAGGAATVDEDRVSALYLIVSEQALRLILRHPSLSRSISAQLTNSNLNACLEASGKLLAASVQLKDLKSLDSTWMQATEFLAAIFTTLFIYTQKQDEMSSAELKRLREDMDAWLEVMGETGNLLGAGMRLKEAVRSIIDYSFGNINRRLAAKTASAGLSASATSADSPTEQPDEKHNLTPPEGYSAAYTNGENDVRSQQAFTLSSQRPESRQSYPMGNQFYPEAQGASIPAYSSRSVADFDASRYNNTSLLPNPLYHGHGSGMPLPHGHPSNPHMAQYQIHPPFANTLNPAVGQNAFHPAAIPVDLQHSGPSAWRDFADSMMSTIGGQDFLHSANALMALGAEKPPGMEMAGADVATIGGLQIPHDGQQIWPLLQYSSHPADRQ